MRRLTPRNVPKLMLISRNVHKRTLRKAHTSKLSPGVVDDLRRVGLKAWIEYERKDMFLREGK